MQTKRRGRNTGHGYQSILCAVDFSPQSAAALQVAADLARRTDARLTTLCVEDPLFGAGATAAGYDVSLLRTSTLKQLKRLVERIAGPLGLSSDRCTLEVSVGKPAASIVAHAKAMHADVIVMGTNGRTGPAELFFGSTAKAVLRRAPVPVLVVPRSRPVRDVSAPQERPVVGALDLGPQARAHARRMAHAATSMGGPLTLVHVVPESSGSGSALTAQGARRREAAAARRLARIAAIVEAAACVTTGAPEEELPRLAAEMNAAIIILALQRGHGLFGRRQGTITYRILCGSTTPVLALPL